MKKSRLFLFIPLLVLLIVFFTTPMKTYAKGKNYTITTKTAPCNASYKSNPAYNSNTKSYFVFRSYLEKLEKEGGGTLTIKKGTYTIAASLYVPSNTTIKLENGVKLKMASKTGTSHLTAGTSMFQLVAPSKSSKNNWGKKYKSSKNIKIIGSGTSVIDMGTTKATGIIMSHNSNVTVSGIQFKKNDSTHYMIEIVGVNKATITNCKFTGTSKKGTAITIDIPASKKTHTRPWIKMDNTVNKNITISNNEFNNLTRGIATLRFVSNKYHSNLKITGNSFKQIKDDAIRAINWSKFYITNNTFDTIGTGGTIEGATKSLKRGIFMAGVKNPQISGNTFKNLPRAIEISFYQNTDAQLKNYKPASSKITAAQFKTMQNANTAENLREYYVRHYLKYKGEDMDKYYFADTTTTYTITPSSTPYRNEYMKISTYNSNTKAYYTFRSYMDQIERNGGGTLIVKAGTYNITNDIPVPSNTTIKLENGVILKKASKTGTSKLQSTTGIFALVQPSMYELSNVAYSGYNGMHDIKILGPEDGTAIIDNNYYNAGLSIIMAHNSNVEIKNITFKNMKSGHFIELDASQNVTIANNIFMGHTDSEQNDKEAINLDTPDKNTGGFGRGWTSYDATANLNVFIRNNTFTDLESGIGTHSYSPGKYHTNIVIEGNQFTNLDHAAIRMMSWKNVTVRNNTLSSVGKSNKYALTLSGVNNPVITGNTIANTTCPVIIKPAKMTGRSNGAANNYAPVYNTISAANKTTLLTTNRLQNVSDSTAYYSNQYPVTGFESWTFTSN